MTISQDADEGRDENAPAFANVFGLAITGSGEETYMIGINNTGLLGV